MRAGNGDGEGLLVGSGNVDEDHVGREKARGLLQMLGQELGVGGRDRDVGGAQAVVGEPAGGGLVAVEVDDVDALAGPGIGACQRHATGGLADAALTAGKGDDHECPGPEGLNAQSRKTAITVSAYGIDWRLSRTIRPSRAAGIELPAFLGDPSVGQAMGVFALQGRRIIS